MANGRLIPNNRFSEYRNLYDFINRLAKKYDVGVDAIALRYCMEIFPRAMVLRGTLTANLKANQFLLTESEIELLSAFGISSNEYWQERKKLAWN